MADMNSPLYELLAVKLDKDPVQDIRDRRGAGESWRAISLFYLTEHGVSVTDVTLRAWAAKTESTPTSA